MNYHYVTVRDIMTGTDLCQMLMPNNAGVPIIGDLLDLELPDGNTRVFEVKVRTIIGRRQLSRVIAVLDVVPLNDA